MELHFCRSSEKNSDQFAIGIDSMISEIISSSEISISRKLLSSIVPYFSSLNKLLSTNQVRALVTFILKKLFSTSSLTHCLGLSGTFLKEIVAYITPFIEQVESKLNSIKDETDQYINEQISVLNAKIKQQSNQLHMKRPQLSSQLIEGKEFELELKRQRHEKFENDPVTTKEQIVRNKFKKWKNKIKSQKGRKARSYLIDRRSETAIYERLAEDAKAH